MKKIFLVFTIGIGVFAFADFSRSDAGVVTDNSTGLEWQDIYKGADNKYVQEDANITYSTWEEAITYCENNLTDLDGGGWRLPNINELITILNYDVSLPAVYKNTDYPGGFKEYATANGDAKNPPEYSDDPDQTVNQQKVRYWSSTTVNGDPTKAWYLNTCYGFTRDNKSAVGDAKDAKNVVRCVRGGQ